MEQIKELTKRLIANSFKELLLQNSFEKITIKMITDHANVIRPTFYNHFHDKYELLEWIFRDEVLDEAEIFEREGKIEEGIHHIFSKFYEDREFYRKAFEITGQNGFADTLSDMFTSFYKEAASSNLKIVKETRLSVDTVARYYSSGLITVLKMLVGDNGSESLEDFLYGYRYLISHALYDI